MKRLLVMAATAAFLLGLGAPVALAAEPARDAQRLLISVNGDVSVPAGERIDTLLVVDGDARVSGDVRTIVVIRGTATLTGATAGTLTVVNGSADLDPGTTVTGDVRTLDGTVARAPGAVVGGSVKTLDADLAAIGILLVPAFILLFIGLGLAAVAVALLVAAFGARQVRSMETLIGRQPGQVLVAGIAGSVVLPILGILLTITVIGAPIGLTMLLVLLPALAFLGWIVAAIWVGDWIVARLRGGVAAERPYLAAVLGVIVLAFAGIVPFVSAIATLFGFGALLLAAWRTFRHEASAVGQAGAPQAGSAGGGPSQAAPSAS